MTRYLNCDQWSAAEHIAAAAALGVEACQLIAVASTPVGDQFAPTLARFSVYRLVIGWIASRACSHAREALDIGVDQP